MMTSTFVHRWVPHDQPSQQALLLLHGTGGTENDLLGVGRQIAPAAHLLAPRGKVLEHGMPRFFRRIAEGKFDIPDLIARAAELSQFVTEAKATYGIEHGKLIAAGYSNGANIASALLLLHPASIDGAMLWRPMVPLIPDVPVDLRGKQVLLLSGENDRTVPAGDTDRLFHLLQGLGAEVTPHTIRAGHELTGVDLSISSAWLTDRFS